MFTKEEVSLCKQVAERHSKEIDYGDWYWDEGLKKAVVQSVKLASLQDDPYFIKNCFPLWTISDCLEFLSKQMYAFERAIQLGSIFDVSFISVEGKTKKGSGDSLLEACLKAVLAVFEEKK